MANTTQGSKPLSYLPRAIAAIILATLTLAVLYLTPRALQLVIADVSEPELQTILNQFIDPITPLIGAIASALVCATILVRKTKLEGPMLLLLGATLLVYSYTLFQGGSIPIQIPTTTLLQVINEKIPIDIAVNITIDLSTIMLASMLTPLLIIVKGSLLIYTSLRRTRVLPAN